MSLKKWQSRGARPMRSYSYGQEDSEYDCDHGGRAQKTVKCNKPGCSKDSWGL